MRITVLIALFTFPAIAAEERENFYGTWGRHRKAMRARTPQTRRDRSRRTV